MRKETADFPPSTRPAVVLLIDADPHHLAKLRELLEQTNYRVVSAEDRPQAMEVAARARPDIVLLTAAWLEGDSSLPASLRRIARSEDLPILLVTAKVSDDILRKNYQTGITDFLLEPFSEPLLAARLRFHLQIVQTLKQLKQGGS